MQYYNTIVKTFNRDKSKNIRIIQFEDLRRKFVSAREKQEYFANHVPAVVDSAERAEVAGSDSERDFKQEALIRAKQRIKSLLRHNYSSRLKMLTLTYANVVSDRKKVLNDLKNLCKRYKARIGSELKYIATFEWQKMRHCLHVHMVIDSVFIPSDTWASELWLQGFVKVNTISHGKSRSDCLNAISYVLKYMSKDSDTSDFYEHLYYRSRNWNQDYKTEVTVCRDEHAAIRYANAIFGCGNFEVSRFWFLDWSDSIVNIIDIFPTEKLGDSGVSPRLL